MKNSRKRGNSAAQIFENGGDRNLVVLEGKDLVKFWGRYGGLSKLVVF